MGIMENAWTRTKKMLYDTTRMGVQTKAREWFPYATRLYGYVDGPLDEDKVDEIIYIEGKDGSQDRVLCRNYGDDRRTFQEHLDAGTSLDDALNVSGGVFTNIGGDCIPDQSLYDDDFERYGCDEAFFQGKVIGELSRARKEFVEDQLRLNKTTARYVGDTSSDDRILVGEPNGMPISQLLYFEAQSVGMSIFNWGWDHLRSFMKFPKVLEKDIESYWVDWYRGMTSILNSGLGFPDEIEAISNYSVA